MLEQLAQQSEVGKAIADSGHLPVNPIGDFIHRLTRKAAVQFKDTLQVEVLAGVSDRVAKTAVAGGEPIETRSEGIPINP